MHRLVFSSFIKEAAAKALTTKETSSVIKQLVASSPKEKKAGVAVPALEAAGLGILAVPGIRTLRDPNASAHDKNHAAWETAGLGVLGAHPMYELGQHALGKGGTHGLAAGPNTGGLMRRAGAGLQNFAARTWNKIVPAAKAAI